MNSSATETSRDAPSCCILLQRDGRISATMSIRVDADEVVVTEGPWAFMLDFSVWD